MVHGGYLDDATLDRNWRLALRVAVASGGLAAALAAALHAFLGLSSGVLVVAAAVVAIDDRQPAPGGVTSSQPAPPAPADLTTRGFAPARRATMPQ